MFRKAIVPLLLVSLVVGAIIVMKSKPKSVVVIKPERKNVTRTLAVTGQVEAISNTTVTSTWNGVQVKRVLVDKGDTVTKAQPLIELDDREPRAALERAEAQLKLAEANVGKAHALVTSTVATELKANAQKQGSISSLKLASFTATADRLPQLSSLNRFESTPALGFRSRAPPATSI